MHADHLHPPLAHEAPVDPWMMLTGASPRIVAGVAADLLRRGLHEVRRAWASAGAGLRDVHPTKGRGCPHGCH